MVRMFRITKVYKQTVEMYNGYILRENKKEVTYKRRKNKISKNSNMKKKDSNKKMT